MIYRYVYGRWDGTQQLFPFDADDLMASLSDELIADGDLMRALQRMMRQGDQGKLDDRMPGLQQLMERLRNQRQQQLNQHNLNSVMDDIKQRLEEIKDRERYGIDQRLEESRRRMDPQRGRGEQENRGTGEQEQDGDQDGGEGQEGQEGQQGQQGQQGQRGDRGSEADRARRRAQRFETDQAGEHGQATSAQSQRGGSLPSEQGQPQQGQGQQGGEQGGEGDLDPEMLANLHKMLEDRAKRKQEFLDQLPQDPAGQIGQLRDYDFMDPEAREKFQELLAMLEQQVMNSFFQGMQQGLQQMTPQDLDNIRNMVRDLNEMLEQRAQGQEPNFQDFMDKHGQFFPGVENLDQLMERMQRQQSAMQSLLDSMSPEQRQQLQGMMDQLLQDDRLRWDLARLSQNLNRLMPMESEQYPFRGDDPLSLQEAMRVMQNLQGLDELEQQLRQAQYGNIGNIDAEMVQELMGDESAEDVRRLQNLVKLLEDAGYVEKRGKKLEVTPRGMRKIGQKALTDIFSHLKKDRVGNHVTDRRGAGGDRTDDTKEYEFGDPFLLDLRGTLMNSVRREGVGSPLKLAPEDFEVYRTELNTQTSTVLMVDMSRSMLLRGCFFAAKKVALALDSLIRGQFPRDTLHIIGFSYQARELKPDALPQLVWDEYEYGTNMQHGFMLARHLLGKQKAANKQIIMITDGEPTAHWEGSRVAFNYPPTYRTIQETLKEVVRCTKDDIVINTFMLERGYYLADFINQVTQINHGRAFFAEPEALGEYLLVDYVDHKKKTKRIR
ncbi:MAG: VWA domain-containing protein [Thermomicrobiales bacterium]